MTSEKPMPAPGQRWRFNGNDLAPASGPHTVTSLRWFLGRVEAVFGPDHACAGVDHMMTLDAWEYLGPDLSALIHEAREALVAAGYPAWAEALTAEARSVASALGGFSALVQVEGASAEDRAALRALCTLYIAITE